MTTPPDISVIIPTCNRNRELQRCLAALSAQTYTGNGFEVIVVDDGSDSSLEPVIAPYRDCLNIQLIEQENAGPARARNTGVRHAAGTLLVFTDDDCEAHPEWLAALDARCRQKPECLIGGRTANGLPDNLYSTASQCLLDYLYEYYGTSDTRAIHTPTSAPAFFASNNLAVPAAAFRELGGFNESFLLAAGEDREFCDRWQEAGRDLVGADEAKIQHFHDLSFGTFCRQHLNYGRGAFHLRKARIQKGVEPFGLEPLRFYRRLLTHPLRTTRLPRAALLIALLGISQVANAIGFLRELQRQS
jgi:GT2 family glycosyltransferase